MAAKKKTAKRKKTTTRKATTNATTTGEPPIRNCRGQLLPGHPKFGGRKKGSLDGVVACKRFLAMKLDNFCEPGGDFDKMIRARCLTNAGREWLWQNVFADFVRKLPPTAGGPIVVFDVSIGADRPFPVGMDRMPMLEVVAGSGSNGKGANGK